MLSDSTKAKLKQKYIDYRGKKMLKGSREDLGSRKKRRSELNQLERSWMGRAKALERSRGDKDMPESARQHLRKGMLKIQQRINKMKQNDDEL